MLPLNTHEVARAAAVLDGSGIVLHATEAVWGLACNAADESAVAALYALKQRPADKGVIVVADAWERVRPWLAPVPATALERAQASWPGPHTWVFPTAAECPPWLAGERGTLAVRISGHEQVRALCAAFAGVLVSTSANQAGQSPARRLDEVDPAIVAAVDCVLLGDTDGLAQPTPIRDVRTGETYRA